MGKTIWQKIERKTNLCEDIKKHNININGNLKKKLKTKSNGRPYAIQLAAAVMAVTLSKHSFSGNFINRVNNFLNVTVKCLLHL